LADALKVSLDLEVSPEMNRKIASAAVVGDAKDDHADRF